MQIRSSSKVDYDLNSWNKEWLKAIAELTAIRYALRRKDTTGILLHKHLLAYPETLDSICKVETLC